MTSFLRLFLIIATLACSLELSADLSFESQKFSHIQDSHADYVSQDGLGESQKSNSDCNTHRDCAQCHSGHCFHALADSPSFPMPSLSSTKRFEDSEDYQDIYPSGLNRPPIA